MRQTTVPKDYQSYPQTSPEQSALAETPSKEDMNRHEYMTIQQTADMFQVEPRTVQTWASKGLLPVIRIAHTTRFKRTDVEAFVDENFRLAGRSAIGGGR